MSAVAIVVGSLTFWFALSPFAAAFVGRGIRLGNTKTPRTAVTAGKATRRPGARHLRVVREASR